MAPRLTIRDIAIAERPVAFRKPFRFGAVTVEGAPQVFVRAEIEVEGRGRAVGASAELMVPKWFDKNPELSVEQTIDELRRSLAIARALYLSDRTPETAFGHHARQIAAQIAACARENIPPLAASYGPAEIDKAILDALLRSCGMDVFAGLARNIVGIDGRLSPDITTEAISAFLGSRKALPRVAIRHTVGMLDELEGPHGLAAIITETGCRYFKIKLGGDPSADTARLAAIADVLARAECDYRVTVDANEQYADMAALDALTAALRHDGRLGEIAQRMLYIEQPLPRELTFSRALGPAGQSFAFIVDEADGSIDAFPRARALGYRGVSSKACKGLYKSLINGARAAQWSNEGRPAFIAAEDLTCQAGLAVQQDTALVAFLGIAHAERNGHHYVDGFADTPAAEARAFLAAHPDIYTLAEDGRVRLAIRDGYLATGSLATPGFASGVDPDLIVHSKSLTEAVT